MERNPKKEEIEKGNIENIIIYIQSKNNLEIRREIKYTEINQTTQGKSKGRAKSEKQEEEQRRQGKVEIYNCEFKEVNQCFTVRMFLHYCNYDLLNSLCFIYNVC